MFDDVIIDIGFFLFHVFSIVFYEVNRLSYLHSSWYSPVGTEPTLQLDATNFSDDDVIVCTVTVEDGYEGTASESAEVVIGNTAPVIGSTTITPETPYSYDTLTCTANDVVDLEGDEIIISYEWNIDGELQTETSNMLSGPFIVGALIACSTTPNDGKIDGEPSEDDAAINNTDPTLDTISISPMVNIEADTLMTCEATASDVDNEELVITYAWTQSDGTVLGTEAELQLDATMVSPGDSLTCMAMVTDPHGATDSQGGTVSVINTEPVVDSTAEITGAATTTSIVTCAATFSDLNDGALTPTFSWTNQSGPELSTATSYTIDATETETGDELTCTAVVEDTDGATIFSAASVIISNTLPTLTGVILSPDPVISTDSLTCSVASTADIDEDVVTVLYEWSVDGIVQSETSNMLPGSLLVGTLISCTATPNDGKENGVPDTADITVTNTPPVVDVVSLDAGPIYTDETVTATVTLSDIDAEQTVSANYTRHVIEASSGGTDTEVQTGTDNTLSGALFNKDDQVYVMVTPNDGVEDGSFVISSPLTISNSEPTGITASVTSSDSFYNDSTLTCSATASDIDPEDAVLTYTYGWSTGDTGANLVLTGSMMPGSDVTCAATATDGSSASISIDATEMLMNRTPTVDSVSLPQAATALTASLFCDATGSDLDGETPTLSYAWTIGGVLNGEVSDTLTDTLLYNNVIECTVTSADAMETGTSMTASTTILNTLPVVHTVVLGPNLAYTDTVLNVTSMLSDVDTSQTGDLNISYQWYADGQMVGMNASNLSNSSLNEHFAKGKSVYVVLTPNDGETDGIPVQSNTVMVLNTAPTAATVSISADNDPAEVGVDDLTCSIDVESVDIDGDTLTYDYTWYDQDGNWADETLATTDLTIVYPGIGTDVGTWTCEVFANDGDIDSAMTDAVYDVDEVCNGSTIFNTQSIASGREVQGGIIADVDGDGFEDALFNEQLDNRLQIYWGDGTGTFSDSNKTQLSIGRSGGPGAVGDIDNDGDNDIVWGLQDSSTMKRIFNNGNRSFSIQSSSESQGPRNMELIDVNGDGNLDVYIYKRFGSCVARKLGNGNGTFGSTSCVTSGSTSFDVSDVDGDGDAEMVLVENGILSLAQLDSNGLIQSSATMNIPVTGWPRFYDIDLDGFDDLFVYNNGELIQMMNDGTGSFDECSLISGLSQSFSDVGDLNQDGLMDYINYTTCGYCSSTNYFVIQQ